VLLAAIVSQVRSAFNIFHHNRSHNGNTNKVNKIWRKALGKNTGMGCSSQFSNIKNNIRNRHHSRWRLPNLSNRVPLACM